jgi:hypothetical protein
MALPHLAL